MDRDKKKTLKEIAAEAGVSIGTVHRAIYGKSGLSETTRQRILKIVDDANYRINEFASLMKRETMRIVVALPRPQREDRFFFRGIWNGVREEAEELSKYKLTFEFIESECRLDKIASELKTIYDEHSDPIDGLITIADAPDAEEWISRFSRRGIPVILIASYEQHAACIASVKTDHRICGQLAADIFSLALPDKDARVLLLPGRIDSYSNRIYAEGFTGRLHELLPDCQLQSLEGMGRTALATKVRDALSREKPHGVFACNARNTFLLCEMLRAMPAKKRPLLIGTDVFDELGIYFDEGVLTASVYQYHREQGKRAVRLMYQHLSGNDIGEADAMLPASLVMRSNYRFFM